LLITHEELRPFYESAGFHWEGPSQVVHGSKPWFAMRRDLSVTTSSIMESAEHTIPGNASIPLNFLEALARPKGQIIAGRVISDFPHGLSDLLEADDVHPGSSVNKFDLVCSEAECGSFMLKKRVAKWVERSSVQIEPIGNHERVNLPALPIPPETAQWWLVTPALMQFENMGISRPVHGLSNNGLQMKLLVCAECNLGPVGWFEEGGSEFWVACSRVAYRG